MYLGITLTAALFIAAPSLVVNSDVPRIDTSSLLNILAHKDGPSGDGHFPECECRDKSCGCCVEMDGHKVCADMSHMTSTVHGISVIFTMDGKVYDNLTVSAENSPPFCFAVQTLKRDGQVCIKPTNFSIQGQSFGVCADLEVEFFVSVGAGICIELTDVEIHGISVQGCVEMQVKILPLFNVSFKLGCFKFPKDGKENRKNPFYRYFLLRKELHQEQNGRPYRMENVLRFVRRMTSKSEDKMQE